MILQTAAVTGLNASTLDYAILAIYFLVVLGIGAASYLTLMRWQQISVMHSQAWNAALSTAEAGVEDALAQLNPSALLFDTNINRGANGWTLQSDGLYHAPRRTLGDNSKAENVEFFVSRAEALGFVVVDRTVESAEEDETPVETLPLAVPATPALSAEEA